MKLHFAQAMIALTALSVMAPRADAMAGDPYANETAAQHDKRMAWWRDAKFGMLIHWGVYAVPAGSHDGKAIDGLGEWIMSQGRIPVASYRAYAKDFNPVNYDPASWAELAQAAGMRYLVITAKHHDGFALFPTATSQWNVVAATPWKKDLIAPMAQAARARGLKFGLCYSQSQDWINPGGAKAGYRDGDGWDAAHKGSFDQYLDTIAVPQVREILTRYQPDLLWWESPHLMTPERAVKLAALMQLRPGIIHNNRLGGGYKGDLETSQQRIPAAGDAGHDWETCMTLNDTWGFKRDDHHWKSSAELIRNLVDIVSKGGNYLLNVGPTASGEIPPEAVKLLKEVGAWMKVNGESIYGTHASPFRNLAWGRCTAKAAGGDTILYLHVLDWPRDGRLMLPSLTNTVKSVALLDGGAPVAVEKSANGLVLVLPATVPDAVCSTLKLHIQGSPHIAENVIAADPDGVIRLWSGDACYEAGQMPAQHQGGQSNINCWTNPQDVVSWKMRVDKAGTYVVQVDAAAPGAGAVLLVQGVGKLAYAVPQTAAADAFRVTKVGEVVLAKGAQITLTLRPVVDGWQPVKVRKVELLPKP